MVGMVAVSTWIRIGLALTYTMRALACHLAGGWTQGSDHREPGLPRNGGGSGFRLDDIDGKRGGSPRHGRAMMDFA